MADAKFSLTAEEAEEIRKLPPNRRLQRLKELEEEKRAALEDAEKATEESMSLTEDLREEAEDELATEEEEEEEAQERKKQDSLEGLVKDAPARKGDKQYGETLEYTTKPFGDQEETLYRTLKGAEQDLERLAEKDEWNPQEVNLYEQAKERVERAGEYRLTNDSLMSELGLANDALHRLKYKH